MKKYGKWVCATCSQDFTREYSANRHNHNIHFGKGIIVRFFEYIIGRLRGKYRESDPLIFRKSNGINLGNLRHNIASSDHLPSNSSYADTIVEKENHQTFPNQQPLVQAKDSKYDFSSSLDYSREVVRRVLEFKKLQGLRESSESRNGEFVPIHQDDVRAISAYLTSQLLDRKYIFAFVGYTCPCCVYLAIYQLEFGSGSTEGPGRIWSMHHECNSQDTNDSGKK